MRRALARPEVSTTIAVILILWLVATTFATAQSLFEPKQLSKKKQAKVEESSLGSADNPVRCDSPKGERAYLRRLRCPFGDPPSFERSGSSGVSPYGMIMDLYTLRCPGEAEETEIYMDMYHTDFIEKRPIYGFTIVEPEPDE